MSSLNQHLPFLHLPSFDVNEAELHLVLALSSMGALYVFEDDHARQLHSISVALLAEVKQFSTYLTICRQQNALHIPPMFRYQ